MTRSMERGATTSSAVAPDAIRYEVEKVTTNYSGGTVTTGFSEVPAEISATAARVETRRAVANGSNEGCARRAPTTAKSLGTPPRPMLGASTGPGVAGN